MKKRILSLILVFCLFVTMMPSISTMADSSPLAVYVSSFGDDNNTGTYSDPYATIDMAYSQVPDGGTIYVMTDLTVRIQINFNENKAVTIKTTDVDNTGASYTASAVVVKRANTNLDQPFNIMAGTVTFSHITLDGNTTGIDNGKPAPWLDTDGLSFLVVGMNSTVVLDAGATVQNISAQASDGSVTGFATWGAINVAGTLLIKDGSLITNIAAASGAIRVCTINDYNVKSYVEMSGGTIQYCDSFTTLWREGSTIYINQSESNRQANFKMTGGIIQYCGLRSSDRCFGTVYLHPDNTVASSFIMTGGTITNNESGNAGGIYISSGTVQMSGDAQVIGNLDKNNNKSNVLLKDGQTISLIGSLSDKANIGVMSETMPTNGNPVTIATGDGTYIPSASDRRAFSSDKATTAGVNLTADNKIVLSNEAKSQNVTISGKVYDYVGGSNSLKGISVGLYDKADTTFARPLGSGTTDSSGNYTINAAVMYSDYTVHIAEKADSYKSVSADVTVNSSSVSNANLTLKQYGKIAVTLSDSSFNAPASLVYDGTTKDYTASVNGVNLVTGTDCTLTYTGRNSTIYNSTTAPTNVGEYTVTFALTTTGNTKYTVSGDMSKDFSITKATLTVTPNSSQSKLFGTADPTLTYTFSGNASGEIPSFSGALSRTSGDSIADYAIDKGTLAITDGTGGFLASNYNLALNSTPVNFSVKAYNPTERATITTPNGDNGWFKSGVTDIVLTAPAGFKISKTGTLTTSDWANSITLDNSDTTGYTASYYLKRTSDGAISGAITSDSYKVDTVAPSNITISYGTDNFKQFMNNITFGLFFKDTVTVKLTATDPTSNVKEFTYQVGNGSVQTISATNGSATFNIDPQFKGNISNVQAKDNAGNVSTTSATEYFAIDKVNPSAPNVNTNGYTSGVWTDKAVVFTVSGVTADSGIAKYQYSTDGGKTWLDMTTSEKTDATATEPFNATKAELTISANTNDVSYIFRAVSNAGNVGASSNATRVCISDADIIATATAINGTNGWYKEGIGDIMLTAPTGFEISAAASGPWTNSIVVDKVDGINKVATYYLKYIASGGVSGAKTFTYKVDTVAPSNITISYGTDNFKQFMNNITFGLFFKDTVTVTLTATDPTSNVKEFTYQVGNGSVQAIAATNGSATFNIDPQFKGNISNVQAKDNAGNVSTTSATEYFSVDKVNPSAPNVNTNGYTSGVWTDKAVVFTVSGVTADSGITKYQYSTDGGKTWLDMAISEKTDATSTEPFNATKATLTVSANSDNVGYSFRAISNAGNVGTASGTTKVCINTAPLKLEDKKTDIKLETSDGTILDPSTVLIVTPILSNETHNQEVQQVAKDKKVVSLYDVKLLMDGKSVSLNGGKVKIALSLTDEQLKKYTDFQIVTIDESGKASVIPSTRSEKVVTFETVSLGNIGVIGIPLGNLSDNSPKTGDSNNAIFWCAFMIVSCGAIITLVIKRTKRTKLVYKIKK